MEMEGEMLSLVLLVTGCLAVAVIGGAFLSPDRRVGKPTVTEEWL